MHILIEWNSAKAAANLRKHEVSFEEGATALLDPMSMAQEDETSEGEARWVLVGMSTEARLLTVVYTQFGVDRIRLISARKATRGETAIYA